MEENDPYRAARRDHNNASPCGTPNEQDAAHSRSGSDSSTKKLTGRQSSYNDDPYARNERTSRPTVRANSYLPYSNHQRDPLAPVPPIYIEDNASIPNDRTISFQVDSFTSIPEDRKVSGSRKLEETSLSIPVHSKKRQGRCCMRWRLITLVTILTAAVIAVIWYFVWPRIPILAFDDAEDTSDPWSWIPDNNNNRVVKAYNATWSLNMTANNEQNWIPTHINDMAVTVINHNTSQEIGSGNSGSLVLSPKKTQLVNIPLTFLYWNSSSNDQTFEDLVNTCIVSNNDSPMSRLQMHIDLIVTIHTAGIAWSSTQTVSSPEGFTCPT